MRLGGRQALDSSGLAHTHSTCEPFQVITILGATGSFGRALTRFLLTHTHATLRLFSRDEVKQEQMQHEFAAYDARLRFILGDIRDLARLNVALYGVDLVVHAAALKQVPKAEYDPDEYVKTNIYGTQNVIHACQTMHVRTALFVSSDKAVEARTLYGNCKAVAQHLWSRASTYDPQGTTYVSLRWGNVHNSRGSVVPRWRRQLFDCQALTLTHPAMTRFWIGLPDAVQCAWFAAQYGQRGCILVPHLPAYRVTALAEAVIAEYAPAGLENVSIASIGIRAAEKLHESLAADDELATAVTYTADGVTPLYYAIPPVAPSWAMPPVAAWPAPAGGQWQQTPIEVPYRSDVWSSRLLVPALRQRLREAAEPGPG